MFPDSSKGCWGNLPSLWNTFYCASRNSELKWGTLHLHVAQLPFLRSEWRLTVQTSRQPAQLMHLESPGFALFTWEIPSKLYFYKRNLNKIIHLIVKGILSFKKTFSYFLYSFLTHFSLSRVLFGFRELLSVLLFLLLISRFNFHGLI